jgi:protein-tyrosine phosphatase
MKTPNIVFSVLLVCMSNICRSPTAAAVLKQLIESKRLGNKVEIDSAGTHGYHLGEGADPRTKRAAASRGYDLSLHCARKVVYQDLEDFDLILAMDKINQDNLRRMASPEQQAKIKLFMDYSANFEDDEVPDPYYGLGHTFDLVLDMLEDGSQGVLTEINKAIRGKQPQ